MKNKSYQREKKSKRMINLLPAMFLLISLVLPGAASAIDDEISAAPNYNAETDVSSVLSETEAPEQVEETENGVDSGETTEETETGSESEEIIEETEPSEESGEPEAEPEEMLLQANDTPAVFSDSAEDINYIIVEKRFVGLPEDKIPASFQISVSSDRDVYILNKDNTTGKREVDGTVIWTWKIIGAGIGTYSVSESNESSDGYSVTKSGEGTVEVKAANMAVAVPVHETTCSHTNWPVRVDGDSNVLFAATLTQGGIAVISKEPLSASQRAAVSSAVLRINGPWKTPVYFYSLREQLQNGKGFELNGATIIYDASAEEIVIGQTRNWQHVATLKYSLSDASNPEIALINTYERDRTNVTVSKSVSGALGDRNKSFDFTVSVKLGEDDAIFKINGTQYTGKAQFSLKHSESVILEDVPVGAAVTVSENDYSRMNYAASYSIDGQSSVGGRTAVLESVGANGNTAAFTNTKDFAPDTGVMQDVLPYALLLGMTAAGTFVAVFRRRKAG